MRAFFFIFILSFSSFAQMKNRAVCEDLFKASCLDKKGNNLFIKKAKELRQQSINQIKKLMDELAVARGNSDHISYLREYFFSKGIRLAKELSDEDKNYLYALDSYAYFEESLLEINKEVEKLANKISSATPYDLSEKVEMTTYIDIKKNLDAIVDLVRDIYISSPAKMGEAIAEACFDLTQDAPSLCNKNKVRDLKVELFRRPSLNKAKFVFEQYKYLLIGANSMMSWDKPWHKQLEGLGSYLSYEALNYISSIFTPHFEKAIKNIMSTKIMHDGLIDYFYPRGLKEKVSNDFQQQKSIMGQYLLEKFEGEHIRNAVDSLSLLKMDWMDKFDDDLYISEGVSGVKVINRSLIDKDIDSLDVLDERFGYDYSKWFLTQNAYYSIKRSYGVYKQDEKINIYPLNLKLYEDSRMGVLRSMAHEIGHRFDPKRSRMNGFNMKKDFNKLMACWRRSDSIKMVDGQEGEAVSDFLASIVIAKMVESLSLEQRETKIKESQHVLCYYDVGSEGASLDHTHPGTALRSSGVIGASPAIRTGLDCNQESSRFVTCGIEGRVKYLVE